MCIVNVEPPRTNPVARARKFQILQSPAQRYAQRVIKFAPEPINFTRRTDLHLLDLSNQPLDVPAETSYRVEPAPPGNVGLHAGIFPQQWNEARPTRPPGVLLVVNVRNIAVQIRSITTEAWIGTVMAAGRPVPLELQCPTSIGNVDTPRETCSAMAATVIHKSWYKNTIQINMLSSECGRRMLSLFFSNAGGISKRSKGLVVRMPQSQCDSN